MVPGKEKLLHKYFLNEVMNEWVNESSKIENQGSYVRIPSP